MLVCLSPQLLAVFRFAALILAYAVCKVRHWWAIAVGNLYFIFLHQRALLLYSQITCWNFVLAV